jgi:peptidoglycan/LPS O-acetylase OafA/YrhL
VLSGFFITGLLVREVEETGTVDVTAFWGKRALRLLPALFLVLGATLAAVMLLYAPIDRPPIAGISRSVALYSGNIDFARNDVNYFSSGENPLLHTWSLAVEEQFYFVWPLLIMLGAYAFTKRRESAPDEDGVGRRRMLIGIAIVGAISFGASMWLTQTSQPWAFFGMPTRIWEFALGGAVALMIGESTEPTNQAAWIQGTGLVTVALAVWLYDGGTPYPGLAAALPAIGAVGLLAGGHRAPNSLVSRTLSIAPLQVLGRLSYAWYLWHWPLVGLGAVLNWEIGVWGKLAWSGAALLLAWLTYWLVEQPARNGGRLARIPTQWLGPVALGASVAAAGVSHAAMKLAERRVAMADQKAFFAARNDRVADECWATTIDEYQGPCVIGDKNSSTVLVLLGDSHAQHWVAGLDRAGKERGWKILAMVKGGCPVADMPELSKGRASRWYRECGRFREAMLQRIVAMKPTAVILSNWDHYVQVPGRDTHWDVPASAWQRGLRRTYSRLTSAGITTIAMRGTPRTWFDVPSCLSRRAAGLPFARACEYNRAESLVPVAIAAQYAAARGLPITFVDMNDQICATRMCSVMKQGIVVFTDDNHLTVSFSRALGSILADRIAEAAQATTGGRRSEVIRTLSELIAASRLR